MLTTDDLDRAFRQHAERLLCQALHMVGRARIHDAQEAVGDAWLKAVELAPGWVDRGVGPLPWLVALTKTAAITQIRDLRTHEDIDPIAEKLEERDNTIGYPGLEDPQTHKAWAEVQSFLTEREAMCVWMICIGGYTAYEATRILGGSVDNVRGTAAYGLKKIRRYFHDHGRHRNACWQCGWPAGSIGHRNACRPVASDTHCPYGHEMTPENTYERVSRGYPRRECRTCRQAQGRADWRRKKVREQAKRNMNNNDRWPVANSAENGVHT